VLILAMTSIMDVWMPESTCLTVRCFTKGYGWYRWCVGSYNRIFFFWIRVKILHLVFTKILPYLHYNMPDSSKLPNPHKCVVLGGVPV
jgi:hypothetical protein